MSNIPPKHIPSCTKIEDISEFECMGDSLSTINYNFSAIETFLCNFVLSAEDWDALYDTTNELSGGWQDAYEVVNELSGGWNSAYLTVGELSSFWLDPITIIYPSASAIDSTHVPTVCSFVATNFPASGYLENQEFYVYTFEYETIVGSEVRTYKASAPGSTYKCGTEPCPGACAPGNPYTPNIGRCGFKSGSCAPGSASVPITHTWEDKYTKEVYGIKLRKVGNSWSYIEDLPMTACSALEI
jgi:hypothetical protein